MNELKIPLIEDLVAPPKPSVEDRLLDILTEIRILKVMAEQGLKGKTYRVFNNQASDAVQDGALDCRNANAIHVEVVPAATSSCNLIIRGASEGGANFILLPDSNASKSSISSTVSYDVAVGSRWIRAELASVSGTVTVYITPFVAGVAAFGP